MSSATRLRCAAAMHRDKVRAESRANGRIEFRPIKTSRAFEEIADQIRTELVSRRLRPGDRLPAERAMAEQFGVSRNTLREGMRIFPGVELPDGAIAF